MNEELLNAETTELVPVQAQTPLMGVSLGDDIDSQDILIPRMLLMQGLSEAVAEGNAQMGDIVNSVTMEKLGDRSTAINAIPLKIYKTWNEYKKVGNKPEFIRSLPFKGNENLQQTAVMPDGTLITRDKIINVYFILTKDILNGEAFPYVVGFKRTSMMAGKQVATHFAKSAMMGRKPHESILSIYTTLKKNEQGTFYVWNIGYVGKADAEQIKAAQSWLQILEATAPKVDDGEGKPAAAQSDAMPTDLDY